MPDITAGSITALYLFDVADAIDLSAIARQLGARAAPARLDDKSPGPGRVRYVQPPVVIDGSEVGYPTLDGFQVRLKFFDYGVVSLMLRRPFSGRWTELVALGQTLIENESLEDTATDACRHVVATVRSAVTGTRNVFLSEDYLVFAIHDLAVPTSAADLLATRGPEIAQLLRGERQALSGDERETVLRHRLSYLTDDLVVSAWNAAFVYDTDAGAATAVELFEFANSQLLELRYHDEVLEGELGRLYSELEHPRWQGRFTSRHQTRAARRVQSLVIDVAELTDRVENAVKFVGDPYSARLLTLVSDRLGLPRWKSSVEDKLGTLDDIRRFAVEQAGMVQANVLELAILLILLLELGLFFAGIMD